MGIRGFQSWLLDHKNIDAIIIGYFLAEAISAFYNSSFDNLITPVLSEILPGNKKDATKFLGSELHIHKFIVGIVRFLFSIYLAYLLRNLLFAIKKVNNIK